MVRATGGWVEARNLANTHARHTPHRHHLYWHRSGNDVAHRHFAYIACAKAFYGWCGATFRVDERVGHALGAVLADNEDGSSQVLQQRFWCLWFVLTPPFPVRPPGFW